MHPGWYASKAKHRKVVPTWNYVVAHACGRLRSIRETEWVLAHLQTLTEQHKSHRPVSRAVSDAPTDFVARQFKGLVGFEIAIEAPEGTWRVGQNKNAADREGVEAELRAEGPVDADVSDLVRERAR